MKKALIVDDLDQNIYLLRSILEGDGFEVICARNGAEALELAQSTPPDVAISDILMPTMDGFTLLRKWKLDNRLHNIPLIIYTATYTDPRDEELALSLGAARFIVKPVDPKVFLNSVRQVMEEDQACHIPSPPCPVDDETVSYRMYNETLIRRLEHKMLALEQEIAKRRQDKEALRWNEEKYRTLFEGMSQGAFYQAADGRLIDVNPAALRIFGLTRQQFLEQTSHSPAWNVICEDGSPLPPDEHPSMAALLTGLPVHDVVAGIFHPQTNAYVWVIINAIPQFLPGQSKPSQVFVTLHDITGRRQAEQRLKAFAARQDALLAAIPDIIMEVDANKVYAWANKPGIEFFGDDVVGREAAFYFEGEQATYDQTQKIFQGSEDLVHVESWQRCRNGQKRLLDWWCHVLKDARGNVTGAISSARDITERKKVEEAQRDLKLAVEQSRDGIAVTDIDGRIRFANEAWASMHGYRVEELIGRNLSMFHTPEQLEREVIPFNKDALANGSKSGEVGHVRKDGTVFPTSMSSTAVAFEGRNASGLLGIARDITDIKKAEEALQENEEKFKAIANYTVGWESWFGMDGKHLWVNPGVEQITGYTAEEIMAMPDFISTVIAEEDRPIFAEHFQKAIHGSTGNNFEFRYLHKNGAKRWLCCSWQPIFDSKGKPLGTRASGHDITDRKDAEEALLDSRRVLQTLISNLPGFVYRCTNDRQWTMEYISEGCQSITGYAPEDFIGNRKLSFNDIVHPDFRELIWQTWQKLLREQKLFENEYPIITAQGNIRWVWERGKGVFASDGRLVFLEGFITDVTDRKQAQEALLAKNAEMEHFTYTVSHDLRSPLVTIRTFLRHLAEDMKQNDGQRVLQDMTFIDAASEKMNAMLDELLQLSRIGRMTNPSIEAPLQELVQEALSLVAGQIENRGVRVTVMEKSFMLYGDRLRLVQVFQNLVDNAVKFMGDQKEPLIEIGAKTKDNKIMCFVRDNGMGIAPRHKEKLFDLFQKLDSTAEGSGLGLALAKRIVETHGGRIWVESEGPGRGACFWFSLPVKSSE